MKIKYYLSKLIKYIHIPAIKNSPIHCTSRIAPNSNIIDTVIRKYSYVGNNCTVIDTEIGNFCSIADNVIIGGAAHPIEWVSTSPVFHKGKNILKKNFSEHPFKLTDTTIIQNDVWIGTNCLIKSGVSIANGAVIGMGSVLTKNVGSYEIWAGNPAKMIRKRFDDKTIKILLKSKWWNSSEDKLTRLASEMYNMEKFIDSLNKSEA
ncbi:MAG: glycosyl transferase family 1 [Sulfurovum sp.]|nr:MAG: glycosyl transferase family 1 [Sulfurovum sp.]